MVKTKIAVFVSGGGTNLQALIDAKDSVLKSGELALVVSSSENAYALTRAKNAGIPAVAVTKKQYGSEYETKLKEVLDSYGIEMIVLAGYMTILTSKFTEKYAGRMINIHPALIPSFCGKAGRKRHKGA